ncbi:MAG: anti-sigma factor [Chloroflexi bacterium]|nr:MAG: anti-sigma factor [Chloroflexota bacterium]
MNCDEVEDILGAYALDALPGELSADVTAHLATCSKHPEAAELRAVAGALAFAAPEAQPSAALKTRLLEALREESEPADAAPRRIGILGRLKPLVRQRAVPYALAGALVIALIALVITNVGGSDEPRRAAISLSGENNAGAVVYELEDGIIVLDAEGLKPLDTAQTYQLWSIASGKLSSLGLIGTAPNGEALAVVRADLNAIESLAVTIEPAGGSIAPTTDPVLEGKV